MYWRYRTPSIWQDMNRLQREMNRLLRDYYPRRWRNAPSFPAVNIWANEESALITAEVPGVNADDIDINVVGETLTLSGSCKAEELPENAVYHRRERGYGRFTRSLQLPYSVDVNKVEATFKNGVLSIYLPRVGEEKPKKIIVKSA
ncbi:MAG: Hsp20/alpha crystallin family protein [Chloroflexota bacterium]